MIVAFFFAMLFIYGPWLVLIAIFIINLCSFAFRRRRHPFEIAAMLFSGGCMAFLYLTPERIALFKEPLETTTIADAPLVVPPFLILHGYFGRRTNDRNDGLTLAETGLFRVLFAAPELGSPIEGEAVLANGSDCAEARSAPGDVFFPSKVGGLLFTARTGFDRCAKYVPGPVDLPRQRLELWPERPPGEPQTETGRLRGIMLLMVSNDDKLRVLARRETHARAVATSLSRLGVYDYDVRPDYSQMVSLHHDPDPVDLVLAAIHVKPDLLPRDGALSDAELARRAAAIVARVSTPQKRVQVAVALAGATRGDATTSEAVITKVAPAFMDVMSTGLEVRVPSDCPTALRAAGGRRALVPICEAAWRSGKPVGCRMPFEPIAFLERCTDIRKTIWNDPVEGRKTLVFAGSIEHRGSLQIAGGPPSDMRHVVIGPDDGLLDLVLVAARPTLWSLEGSVGCLDRVTVVGEQEGVVGIGPERVQFRDRKAVYLPQNTTLGRELADLLGSRPERIVSFSNDGVAVVGDQGHRDQDCRTLVQAPRTADLQPDQVVTNLMDVAFNGHFDPSKLPIPKFSPGRQL